MITVGNCCQRFVALSTFATENLANHYHIFYAKHSPDTAGQSAQFQASGVPSYATL